MTALALCLLVVCPGMPVFDAGADPLPPVREAYYAAVQDPDAIETGLRLVDEARDSETAQAGSAEDAVLTAYRGALITLRAKHGVWPPTRLRQLRQGLAILDREVETSPDEPEIRYLRLMSCYYLPGILGRGWSVREDFAALARLLPSAAGRYPPELYMAIVQFVLDHGELTEPERRPLVAALAEARDA